MVAREDRRVAVRPFGPLTFVFYQEPGFDGLVGAHCLELVIGGQGSTREEATEDLQSAIETYVLHHLDTGEPMEVRSAMPDLANLPDRATYHLLVVQIGVGASTTPPEVVFAQPPDRFTPGFVAAR